MHAVYVKACEVQPGSAMDVHSSSPACSSPYTSSLHSSLCTSSSLSPPRSDSDRHSTSHDKLSQGWSSPQMGSLLPGPDTTSPPRRAQTASDGHVDCQLLPPSVVLQQLLVLARAVRCTQRSSLRPHGLMLRPPQKLLDMIDHHAPGGDGQGNSNRPSSRHTLTSLVNDLMMSMGGPAESSPHLRCASLSAPGNATCHVQSFIASKPMQSGTAADSQAEQGSVQQATAPPQPDLKPSKQGRSQPDSTRMDAALTQPLQPTTPLQPDCISTNAALTEHLQPGTNTDSGSSLPTTTTTTAPPSIPTMHLRLKQKLYGALLVPGSSAPCSPSAARAGELSSVFPSVKSTDLDVQLDQELLQLVRLALQALEVEQEQQQVVLGQQQGQQLLLQLEQAEQEQQQLVLQLEQQEQEKQEQQLGQEQHLEQHLQQEQQLPLQTEQVQQQEQQREEALWAGGAAGTGDNAGLLHPLPAGDSSGSGSSSNQPQEPLSSTSRNLHWAAGTGGDRSDPATTGPTRRSVTLTNCSSMPQQGSSSRSSCESGLMQSSSSMARVSNLVAMYEDIVAIRRAKLARLAAAGGCGATLDGQDRWASETLDTLDDEVDEVDEEEEEEEVGTAPLPPRAPVAVEPHSPSPLPAAPPAQIPSRTQSPLPSVIEGSSDSITPPTAARGGSFGRSGSSRAVPAHTAPSTDSPVPPLSEHAAPRTPSPLPAAAVRSEPPERPAGPAPPTTPFNETASTPTPPTPPTLSEAASTPSPPTPPTPPTPPSPNEAASMPRPALADAGLAEGRSRAVARLFSGPCSPTLPGTTRSLTGGSSVGAVSAVRETRRVLQPGQEAAAGGAEDPAGGGASQTAVSVAALAGRYLAPSRSTSASGSGSGSGAAPAMGAAPEVGSGSGRHTSPVVGGSKVHSMIASLQAAQVGSHALDLTEDNLSDADDDEAVTGAGNVIMLPRRAVSGMTLPISRALGSSSAETTTTEPAEQVGALGSRSGSLTRAVSSTGEAGGGGGGGVGCSGEVGVSEQAVAGIEGLAEEVDEAQDRDGGDGEEGLLAEGGGGRVGRRVRERDLGGAILKVTSPTPWFAMLAMAALPLLRR